MNGPMRAVLLAALCLGWVIPSNSLANETVDQARALLAKGDAKGAVALIETALPNAGADLGPMVVVLRQAYTRAADQAAKAGKTEEAEELRENLQILNRRLRGKPDEPPIAPSKPATPIAAKPEAKSAASIKGAPEPKIVEIAAPSATEATVPPEVAPPAALELNPPTEPAQPTAPVTPPAAAPESLPIPIPAEKPAETPAKPVEIPANDPVASAMPALPDARNIQSRADRAYLAAQYLDAASGYAELARLGKLPEDRKIHWAYCRSVAVVKQIKAKPATQAEWAAIDREILEIKALSPRYWYAEYLRNRAADQSKSVAKQPRGRVVRGAMPENERPADQIRDLTRNAPAVAAQAQ